jgi:hypothetical protein
VQGGSHPALYWHGLCCASLATVRLLLSSLKTLPASWHSEAGIFLGSQQQNLCERRLAASRELGEGRPGA